MYQWKFHQWKVLKFWTRGNIFNPGAFTHFLNFLSYSLLYGIFGEKEILSLNAHDPLKTVYGKSLSLGFYKQNIRSLLGKSERNSFLSK